MVDSLADGIARLEQDPCLGVRLRGVPGKDGLCEYRITRRRKSWRIIYEVRPPGPVAYIHLIGEHYLPVLAATYLDEPKRPSGRLAAQAGLPDIYVDLVRHRGLTEQQIREMVREIVRGVNQPKCC